MCSTPFGINGTITSSVAHCPVSVLSCSTPFGINGTITPTRVLPQPASGVLNAFRHQQNNHRSLDWFCHSAPLCSTPFGINGTITFAPVFSSFRLEVCSTPFGINGTITRLRAFDGRNARGAQRLSASTEQ